MSFTFYIISFVYEKKESQQTISKHNDNFFKRFTPSPLYYTMTVSVPMKSFLFHRFFGS